MVEADKIEKYMPDFLIIGAGKSGTTSLFFYLKQHPEIYIPDVKEPDFFGYEMFSEKDFIGKPIINHYKRSITNLEEYIGLFKKAGKDQKKGDISNTYLYHEKAPKRIFHYIPNVKLIAVLRQPAERLYSRYMHLARENQLPTPNFLDCLDKNSVWWERNDLVPEGFYYRNLSRYYDLFDPSQIKVFLFEELKNDQDKLIKEIYRFLDVDEEFTVDYSTSYNKSGLIRSKAYDRIFGKKGMIKRMVAMILSDKNYRKLKGNKTVRKYKNMIRDFNLKKPPLDLEAKQKVTEEIYRDDIIKLSKLIDRDLSHWVDLNSGQAAN